MHIILESDSKVGIVSHVDLDGVASAIIVREAVETSNYRLGLARPVVNVKFIGYGKGISDRIVEMFDGKGYDYAFITDISIRNNPSGTLDMDVFIELVRRNPFTQFVWFDHHDSSMPELIPENLSNIYHVVVKDESAFKCGADICWDELWENFSVTPQAPTHLIRHFNHIQTLTQLAHDYDITKPDGEWRKEMPGSVALTDAIFTLGPNKVYSQLCEDASLVHSYMESNILGPAIDKARDDRNSSIALASSTCKEITVNGQRIRVAVCNGYCGDVGQKIADGDTEVASIMLDLRHETAGFTPMVSLRRADHSSINLKSLAEKLGGGGHVFAAGGSIPVNLVLDSMVDATVKYLEERLG